MFLTKLDFQKLELLFYYLTEGKEIEFSNDFLNLLKKLENFNQFINFLLKKIKNNQIELDDEIKNIDSIELHPSKQDMILVKYFDNSNRERKTEMKLGKFLNLLSNSLKNAPRLNATEIEKIVKQFYALRSGIDDDYEFRLVSGSDIQKYYKREMMECEEGSLGGSCMANDEKNKYIRFYTLFSPKFLKLLIKVNKKTDKIVGRALIWNTNLGLYMDRIYVVDDKMFNEFVEVGKNKFKIEKFYDKTYKNLYVFVDEDTDELLKYETGFPFLDTFKYFIKDLEKKVLLFSNDINFLKKIAIEKKIKSTDNIIYEINTTNGAPEKTKFVDFDPFKLENIKLDEKNYLRKFNEVIDYLKIYFGDKILISREVKYFFDADIRDFNVDISFRFTENELLLRIEKLIWHNGVWRNGEWSDTFVKNSKDKFIWKNGKFENGSWSGGTWENGEFYGRWYNGIWKNGVFNGGLFNEGEWYDGIFKDGIFQDSKFYGGKFLDGIFLRSEFHDGEFHGGDFDKTSKFLGGKWLDKTKKQPKTKK